MNELFLIAIGAGLIVLSGVVSLYFKRLADHPLDYLYSIDPSVASDPDYFRQVGRYQATKKPPELPGDSVRYDWVRLD